MKKHLEESLKKLRRGIHRETSNTNHTGTPRELLSGFSEKLLEFMWKSHKKQYHETCVLRGVVQECSRHGWRGFQGHSSGFLEVPGLSRDAPRHFRGALGVSGSLIRSFQGFLGRSRRIQRILRALQVCSKEFQFQKLSSGVSEAYQRVSSGFREAWSFQWVTGFQVFQWISNKFTGFQKRHWGVPGDFRGVLRVSRIFQGVLVALQGWSRSIRLD